jgi:ureidoglycolate lyase
MRTLTPVPLSPESFAPYGEVIELDSASQRSINAGLTTRYHDLCRIDCSAVGGRVTFNIFRTDPLPLPHEVKIMERHPLGSQAFFPLDDDPFLVMVAPPGEQVDAEDLILFRSNGRQGVNFARNTWHHFQIASGRQRDFVVIDRAGPGNNLEEVHVSGEAVLAYCKE